MWANRRADARPVDLRPLLGRVAPGHDPQHVALAELLERGHDARHAARPRSSPISRTIPSTASSDRRQPRRRRRSPRRPRRMFRPKASLPATAAGATPPPRPGRARRGRRPRSTAPPATSAVNRSIASSKWWLFAHSVSSPSNRSVERHRRRQSRSTGRHRPQAVLRDRAVHVLGDRLVAGRVRRRVLGEDAHRVRLEREAEVHDLDLVADRRRQVEHLPAREEVDPPAVREVELLDVRVDHPVPVAISRSPATSISVEKWPMLPSIAPSLSSPKCSRPDDARPAGHGDDRVRPLGGLLDRRDEHPLVGRLEGPDRVDLHDDDDGAHRPQRPGEAPPAPAEADDGERLARDERVGRAEEAVDRRGSDPALALERELDRRVVDHDDRERDAARPAPR